MPRERDARVVCGGRQVSPRQAAEAASRPPQRAVAARQQPASCCHGGVAGGAWAGRALASR
eukprot:5737077-Prymnesium_polylepis.1